MREKVDNVTCGFAERFPHLIGTEHPGPPMASMNTRPFKPRSEPRANFNSNYVPINTAAFLKFAPAEMKMNKPPPKNVRYPPSAADLKPTVS